MPMMSDHETLSQARNELADALKCLLKAEIMGPLDFQKSRQAALTAVDCLDHLLRLKAGVPSSTGEREGS